MYIVKYSAPVHMAKDGRACDIMKKLLSLEIRGTAYIRLGGGSGGAMVLGKLPVPGRPTNLN